MKKVIASYVFCFLIIFLPSVVVEYSGVRLIALKVGVFILGNICGIGLQRVTHSRGAGK